MSTPARDEQFKLTFGDRDGPLLLEQTFNQTRMAMCMTDPSKPDNPIVYANRAFLELTGYEEDEVLGRNCRFMQGPDTDEASVQELRDAIRDHTVCIVELLNYRKNGERFWNALHVGPIFDEHGDIRYYFGSQWDVTNVHSERVRVRQAREVAKELNHRIKNLFAVMASIVSLSAHKATDPGEAADSARSRIAALGRAHNASLNPLNSGGAANVRRMAEEVLSTEDLGSCSLEGPDVDVDATVVTPLGLALHEMSTNSRKFGALGGHATAMHLRWGYTDGGALELNWTDTFADPLPSDITPGVGSRIMRSLIQSVGGSFEMVRAGNTHRTSLILPPDAVSETTAMAGEEPG